ncbi:hypothetical protein RUM44_009559 [Polyplax serrata]|uniref:PIPK domain-containing protein n=1 Tax=Polyplax serrata TaxID=468196 RepID=A0ABR1AT12_POLSC
MEDGKPSTAEKQDTASTSSSSLYRISRLRRIPDAEVMTSIQMAVESTVSALDHEPERDLLIQDFMTFESLSFRRGGSSTKTSQSSLNEFKFYNYAPIAFKYFRRLFQIQTKNFLLSMCSEPLRMLENSGASGSVFYLTHDDEYILKTAQHREGDFLLKLLPGYYLNLTQNPRTLLPKFFGFYCYSGLAKNLRIVVMNNIIPSSISIDQRYDIKGSTTKRKATILELKKPFPTYKDLDFIEHHPDGIFLDPETYAEFVKALQRDCRVLESFKIIDYSLLLAVHRVDRTVAKPDTLPSGIPAWTATGDELLLYVGIIDILQSYQFRKKMEHTLKSMIYEKDSISVHRPDFYSQRFQNFIFQTVFQPFPKQKSRSLSSKTETQPCSSDRKQTSQNPLSLSWISNGLKYAKKQAISFLNDENVKVTTRWDPRKSKLYERVEDEGNVLKENLKTKVDEEGEPEKELNLIDSVSLQDECQSTR